MALGISPTVDYAFKRLFGDPQHVRVLIHLLNSIFEHQFVVDDVEIVTPILEKDFEDDKLSDLRVRDTRGRQPGDANHDHRGSVQPTRILPGQHVQRAVGGG